MRTLPWVILRSVNFKRTLLVRLGAVLAEAPQRPYALEKEPLEEQAFWVQPQVVTLGRAWTAASATHDAMVDVSFLDKPSTTQLCLARLAQCKWSLHNQENRE